MLTWKLMKISKSCSKVIQRTLRSRKNWLRYVLFSAISRVKWTKFCRKFQKVRWWCFTIFFHILVDHLPVLVSPPNFRVKWTSPNSGLEMWLKKNSWLNAFLPLKLPSKFRYFPPLIGHKDVRGPGRSIEWYWWIFFQWLMLRGLNWRNSRCWKRNNEEAQPTRTTPKRRGVTIYKLDMQDTTSICLVYSLMTCVSACLQWVVSRDRWIIITLFIHCS